MTVKLVGTLVKGSIDTAVGAVRHPVGTAAHAVGLAKGAVEAGVGLGAGVLRGVTGHGSSPPANPWSEPADSADTTDSAEDATGSDASGADPLDSLGAGTMADPETTGDATASDATSSEEAPSLVEQERENLRGPDLAPVAPPDPDELPEPVVIHADDDPGEAFHTEPKAASRESAHEGLPGDREEAEGYVEEVPEGIEQPRG